MEMIADDAVHCYRMYETDSELCEGMLIKGQVTAAGKLFGTIIHQESTY